MDLIRLIKLKKINGELDNLTEQEKLFFSLFNGLRLVKEYNSIYFFNGIQYFFEYDLKYNVFYCSYSMVWVVFKNKYNLNDNEIIDLITGILERHLKLVGITTFENLTEKRSLLERHLKLVGITTEQDLYRVRKLL